MSQNKTEVEVDKKPAVTKKNGEESEEESDILEESPCGRWQKRREEIQQSNITGIDCAFLAMDTEEGVEVVWNEVRIGDKKSKVQVTSDMIQFIQEDIHRVFNNLMELDHANIAKFHKYWTDNNNDKPRVVFITEYMSSGSLRQYLKKTKRSNRTLKSWKRWCTQILSALSYLHGFQPPIIHGNLTTDTIFIQQNGLIKIGSVAPEAIYNHVKMFREEIKNSHYAAPEYRNHSAAAPSVDIYSFGICAAEMAAMELTVNGEAGQQVCHDALVKVIDSIEDPLQKDFIKQCIETDPSKRPTAHDLLFHPILFEVHSLKLLAAHVCIKGSKGTNDDFSSLITFDTSKVFAEIPSQNGKPAVPCSITQANILDLEKFLEDVKTGVYPLTAVGINPKPMTDQAIEPEFPKTDQDEPTETNEVENRRVIQQSCQIVYLGDKKMQLTILLRMDDQMNRHLSCEMMEEDTSQILVDELVFYGFINLQDASKIGRLLDERMEEEKSKIIRVVPATST